MVKIAICDDQKEQRTTLKKEVLIQLELCGIEFCIYEFASGEELLRCKDPFEIIFLDIEMDGINGVETARNLRSIKCNSIIIFVTAYPDFVFQGYEVKALNYILKPYKSQKIAEVIKSALLELELSLDSFLKIEARGETQKINLSQTLYFASDKRKVTAYTQLVNIDFYEKLDILQNQLPSFFIRIHQRYLVNLNFVTAASTSSCSIENITLPVSRKYSQTFVIAFARTMLK